MPTCFLPYEPKQDFLLPPSLSEWLPENHLAYFVGEIVDRLDLQKFYARYEGDGRGTQKSGTFPIHPKMYEAISSADIILVDLTGVRPNVCVEAGFALQHHEKNRLIFMFQPTRKSKDVPFDLNTFRYERVKDTVKYRIR